MGPALQRVATTICPGNPRQVRAASTSCCRVEAVRLLPSPPAPPIVRPECRAGDHDDGVLPVRVDHDQCRAGRRGGSSNLDIRDNHLESDAPFREFTLRLGTDDAEHDRIYPAVIAVGQGSLVNTSYLLGENPTTTACW